MPEPVFSWNAKTTEEKDKNSDFTRTLPKTKRPDPTLAGGLIRDLARAPATIAVRPGQMLAALKGFTPEEQTVKSKYLGDIKPSMNKKDVIKDIGRAVETVSYGVGASGLAKNSLTKIAGIEGLTGALGSGGHSVAEGNSTKKVLKDTAIGGAIGAVAGVGFAKLAPMFSWGKKGVKIAKEAPVVPTTISEGVLPPPVTRGGTQPNPLNAEGKVNYEPYTPDSELPIIQMGAKPKSDLPTIQTEARPTVTPSTFKYEPINQNPRTVTLKKLNPDGTPMEAPKMEKPVSNDVTTQGSKNTDFGQSPTSSLESPISLNDTNVPKSSTNGFKRVTSEANNINDSFVKQGIAELLPEEKAVYKGFNEADQIAKVTDHLNNNPEFTNNLINGIVPNDLNPQVAFNAVKNKAIAEGDFQTQRLLAKSKIATEKSKAASTLRASQVLNNPGDAVEIMTNLNSGLEKAVTKRQGKDVGALKQQIAFEGEKQFQDTIKKSLTKQSFSEFVNSIQC